MRREVVREVFAHARVQVWHAVYAVGKVAACSARAAAALRRRVARGQVCAQGRASAQRYGARAR